MAMMITETFAFHLGQVLGTLLVEGTAAARPRDVLREIRRLQRTLGVIAAVLGDAERKRMTDKALNFWVKELKDIMYDADDVLDLCHKEFRDEMSQQPALPPRTCCRVLPSFTRVNRRHRIAIMIRTINERLDEISERRNRFHLQPLLLQTESHATAGVHRRASPIVTPDVVGMGKDTRELVSLLLKENTRPGNLVFAVTGMGGIGKTTLAQKVYSDYSIKNNFQINIWVLVSQHFSETDVLKGIISFITGTNSFGASTRAQLEVMLSGIIHDRRFFLVLDDVWSIDVWEHLLRNPMRCGAAGSRILVTTRDRGVAERMGAFHIHQVKPLGYEDSWLLLCKTVLMDDEDDREMGLLGDVGGKIVMKCGGLPLALKSVGQILRTKGRSQREWSKVLETVSSSRSWFGEDEELMGPLYLSFEALPSRLKPCFLYCSLFPENRVLARRDLMQLWIAEGFVEPHPNLSLEEIAEDYYAEIAARSLLQLEIDDRGRNNGCRMHDLIRDLALILAEDDSYTGDLRRLQGSTTTRLRRLSIGSRDELPTPAAVMNQKGLRALLIFDKPLTDGMAKDLIEQLKHLRVLDLRGTGIQELPSSIGSLFHLRYLNLSRTRIRQLPDTIKDLLNLQFLNLNGCKDLYKFPRGITQLRNLRSLVLLGTNLPEILSGIGEMNQLNTLLGLVASSGSMKELKNLSQLRDLHLQMVTTAGPMNAGEAELQNKNHLRTLVLSCEDKNHPIGLPDFNSKSILEELQPPGCLEELNIECYAGHDYPSWMFSPSRFTNLERLNLLSCTFCESLPPLGQLPKLRYLEMKGSLKLYALHEGFYGGGSPFPRLERLEIEEMPNWEEWLEPEHHDALPRLRVMQLGNCPKLRSLPPCLQYTATVLALTEVMIEAADSLRSIENLGSVEKLHLKDCTNLESIVSLPSLEFMEIVKCPSLVDVEDVEALQHLVLVDFAMETLPEWLSTYMLMNLHTLEVAGNSDLLRRLKKDGLEWSKVAHIPHLYAQATSYKHITYPGSRENFGFPATHRSHLHAYFIRSSRLAFHV